MNNGDDSKTGISQFALYTQPIHLLPSLVYKKSYLIYFEFVSFNVYDAINQHIVSVEAMEMLSMVPEFLHVDTNDLNGLPYINIRIVSN